MLNLFTAKGTCALACHIALAESGADYTITRLDFSREQQRQPDYLAVNPKSRVPALVTPNGVLTEVPAILAYVALSFPQARLLPQGDPFAFAEALAFNTYLCATVHVAHAHRIRGYRWTDDPAAIEALKAKVAQNMSDCFRLIETTMLKGPWVLGEAYSACDPYLFTICNWLEGDGVDIAAFPKVSAHYQAMAARPAAKRALAELAA